MPVGHPFFPTTIFVLRDLPLLILHWCISPFFPPPLFPGTRKPAFPSVLRSYRGKQHAPWVVFFCFPPYQQPPPFLRYLRHSRAQPFPLTSAPSILLNCSAAFPPFLSLHLVFGFFCSRPGHTYLPRIQKHSCTTPLPLSSPSPIPPVGYPSFYSLASMAYDFPFGPSFPSSRFTSPHSRKACRFPGTSCLPNPPPPWDRISPSGNKQPPSYSQPLS